MKFWKKKEKKEYKELGRHVTWEEWEKCDLPSCVESHMISIANDKGELITSVGRGLVGFDIILKDKKAYFLLHSPMHNKALKKYEGIEQFMFCVSDDPSMEYAGDWTQMGCMRIFFVLNGPTMTYGKDYLLVTCAFEELIIRDSYNKIDVDKEN